MQIEDLDVIHFRPSASVDNVLQDLHDSSHHTKAECNIVLLFIQNSFF